MTTKSCKPDCDLPVMGMGTQSKNNKIFISVTDPIQGCINIRTNAFTSLISKYGTPSTSFFKADRPKDQMNCPAPLCITTGTLKFGFVLPESGEFAADVSTSLVYESDEPAVDYINGVVSGYVTLYSSGSYTVKFLVTDQCNGNVVELSKVVSGGDSEIYPKTELVQFALSEATTLLSSSDCGMKITAEFTPADAIAAGKTIGFSSLSMVKDKSDFEMNEMIAFTCVDELDFPNDVDLTDPTCLGQAPDDSSITLELTITAQQVTGNYMRLNPLLHKLDSTTAFAVDCVNKTIGKITVNGTELTGIRLPNFYQDECSYVSAYLPACDANEGRLNYSSIKNLSEPDLEAFKLVTDEVTGDKFIFFNSTYIDQSITIFYPVKKAAIKYEANTNFVEGRQIRVMVPFKFKNGWEGYIHSENAFVTSFPFGWSTTEDTPLEFTIVFMRVNNKYYDLTLLEQN